MSEPNKKRSAYFDRIRLGHRKPETMNMDAKMFAQSVGLSHLAVDLARLALQRGDTSREPVDFLNDAAHLVNEAAKHTGFISEEALDFMLKESAEQRKAEQTPISALHGPDATGVEVIMDDGSKFMLPPFTSERGWKEFLEKHFRRRLPDNLKSGILENLLKSLDEKAGETVRQRRESALKAAVGIIYPTAWNGLEHLLEQAAAENQNETVKNWPKAVLERWVDLQTKWSAENWPRYWAADGLNYATLQSLAETKRLGNKAKGSGKRRTAKPTEETGNKVSVKAKKQGTARKKQGRG